MTAPMKKRKVAMWAYICKVWQGGQFSDVQVMAQKEDETNDM